MHAVITRWLGVLILAFTTQVITLPASADSTQTSTTPEHVAIQGYDVVSYFTDGKPVKGSSDISVPFEDSRWQFANTSHKEMFAANPDHYLPQYGGLCAGGMAMGVSVPANPENWVIVDGKLYMVSGGKSDLDAFKQHAAEEIEAANANWAKLNGN